MRFGVRIGVDVGQARIGVARCDPHALLATPVETLARCSRTSTTEAAETEDVLRLLALTREYAAIEVVVGLPLGLRGQHTKTTDDAVGFAQRLAQVFAREFVEPPLVRLVDERFSTVAAQAQLHQVGKTHKRSRAVIDQAAAVVILQHALDGERMQGDAPGTVLVGAATAESAVS